MNSSSVDLRKVDVDAALVGLLPIEVWIRFRAIPLALHQGRLLVGMLLPARPIAVSDLALLVGYDICPVALSEEGGGIPEVQSWSNHLAESCSAGMKTAVELALIEELFRIADLESSVPDISFLDELDDERCLLACWGWLHGADSEYRQQLEGLGRETVQAWLRAPGGRDNPSWHQRLAELCQQDVAYARIHRVHHHLESQHWERAARWLTDLDFLCRRLDQEPGQSGPILSELLQLRENPKVQPWIRFWRECHGLIDTSQDLRTLVHHYLEQGKLQLDVEVDAPLRIRSGLPAELPLQFPLQGHCVGLVLSDQKAVTQESDTMKLRLWNINDGGYRFIARCASKPMVFAGEDVLLELANGWLRVHDLQKNGHRVIENESLNGRFLCATPDANHALTVFDCRVLLWDLSTGQTLLDFPVDGEIKDVQLSQDASRILVIWGERAQDFELLRLERDGGEVRIRRGLVPVGEVWFENSQACLAVSADDQLQWQQTASGALLAEVCPASKVEALCLEEPWVGIDSGEHFSLWLVAPQPQLVGSWRLSKFGHVYDLSIVETAPQLQAALGGREVCALSYYSERQLALVAATDGQLLLWGLDDDRCQKTIQGLANHPVDYLGLDGQGRVLALSDTHLQIFDSQGNSWTLSRPRVDHCRAVCAERMLVHYEGPTGARWGEARVHDLRTGRDWALPQPAAKPWAGVFAGPPGRPLLLNCVQEGHFGEPLTSRLWQLGPAGPVLLGRWCVEGLRCLAISPSGSTIGFGTSQRLSIHRVTEPTNSPLCLHDSRIRSMQICDNGRVLATASTDQTAAAFDLQTGTCLLRTPPDGYWPWILLSGDGRWLQVTSQRSNAVYDLRSGRSRGGPHQLSREGREVHLEGCHLVVNCPSSGEHLLVYTGHEQQVSPASVCPYAPKVASGDDSGQLRVWHLDSGETLAHFQHTEPIRELEWLDPHTLIFNSSRTWHLEQNRVQGFSGPGKPPDRPKFEGARKGTSPDGARTWRLEQDRLILESICGQERLQWKAWSSCDKAL